MTDSKLAAADWMRNYFRQARVIDQLTARLIDDSAPARSGLYALYQDWRSRLSNADFSVVRGHIFARHATAFADDPLLLLRLFEMAARHGLPLSRETETLVNSELARRARQCFARRSSGNISRASWFSLTPLKRCATCTAWVCSPACFPNSKPSIRW